MSDEEEADQGFGLLTVSNSDHNHSAEAEPGFYSLKIPADTKTGIDGINYISDKDIKLKLSPAKPVQMFFMRKKRSKTAISRFVAVLHQPGGQITLHLIEDNIDTGKPAKPADKLQQLCSTVNAFSKDIKQANVAVSITITPKEAPTRPTKPAKPAKPAKRTREDEEDEDDDHLSE